MENNRQVHVNIDATLVAIFHVLLLFLYISAAPPHPPPPPQILLTYFGPEVRQKHTL